MKKLILEDDEIRQLVELKEELISKLQQDMDEEVKETESERDMKLDNLQKGYFETIKDLKLYYQEEINVHRDFVERLKKCNGGKENANRNNTKE